MAVPPKTITFNVEGFAMLDILQMKNNINPKWQVATKPMLGGEANSSFVFKGAAVIDCKWCNGTQSICPFCGGSGKL